MDLGGAESTAFYQPWICFSTSVPSEPKCSDVTCVMTFFNESEYFGSALNSVLESVPPSQVIVIDDCSRPEESLYARVICESNGVFYHRLARNAGLSGARMEGLSLVETNLVMFMDSDDLLDAEYVRKLRGAMSSDPGISFVMGVQRFFSETPGDRNEYWPRLPKSVRDVIDEPCISGAGVIHRVDVLTALRGFRPNWSGRFEDWDLGLRMVAFGCRGVSVRDACYWYRRRPGTLTAQITPERRAAIDFAIASDYPQLIRSITTEAEFLSRRFLPLLFGFIRNLEMKRLVSLLDESRHLIGLQGLIRLFTLLPVGAKWLLRARQAS